MSKIDRVVKRNKERALKARGLREKAMLGRAFEKGIEFGMRLFQAKLESSTKDLTYE